jgi:hypothetical protein
MPEQIVERIAGLRLLLPPAMGIGMILTPY